MDETLIFDVASLTEQAKSDQSFSADCGISDCDDGQTDCDCDCDCKGDC